MSAIKWIANEKKKLEYLPLVRILQLIQQSAFSRGDTTTCLCLHGSLRNARSEGKEPTEE